MTHPIETPCALRATVSFEAANEEQTPSPEGVYEAGLIAADGEGGILYTERMLAARGGPGRAGEGPVPPINYQPQPQPTLSEPPTCPNPIAFLPSDLPIGDVLVYASRLAQYYSDLQGQVPL